MIVMISTQDKAVFLYDSTTMRALPMEAFDDEEKAESFLQWYNDEYVPFPQIPQARGLQKLRSDELEFLYAEWQDDCLDEDGELIDNA